MKNLLFLMAISAMCASLSAQNLYRVNNNIDFDADYTTFQDAVTAASNNDTIYVEGSPTEYEGATINKPLVIVGPGFFLGENPKTQANTSEATFNSSVVFESGSSGSVIMGCAFTYTDLTINVDDITAIRNYLYDVIFEGNSNNIVLAQNFITHRIIVDLGVISNAVISNNIIRGRMNSENTSGPLIISNNVFCSTSYNFPIDCYNANIQNNILILEDAIIEVNTGNSISYNILAGAGTNSNGNQYNVDMTTVFADFDGSLGLSTDSKWKLLAGSPALNAGIGGVDCGAYGGAMPYILSGIPDLPHIYEANVSGSATTESGLHVTISVKSGE
jgi:hypothetical protein